MDRMRQDVIQIKKPKPPSLAFKAKVARWANRGESEEGPSPQWGGESPMTACRTVEDIRYPSASDRALETRRDRERGDAPLVTLAFANALPITEGKTA